MMLKGSVKLPPVCQRDIIITYNKNKTDSRNVTEFYEFLTDFFKKRKDESYMEKS